ncbi:2-oxoglutarate/2-oxoacid ferredoxin oxidoreductase, beta subunit [hydrothermal vent metagenome]|uniref:2-oxoglutarate/2-oxoacid ferredoxin oxidoreductase, beta subunit n=1 Tax=hydrothermal vent metagenome TaxID=652676 RepID=A0A3B1DB35_9ZZZZ
MIQVFKRPESLKNVPFRFCPGCGHSIVHRLVAECIDELGIRERTIGTAPVGCAVFAYDYFNFDVIECAHGRPPAVATALKRVMPDNVVFSYQGDGDLASIGLGEIVHAANRGENLSVFFINNATYGMTGGQMAPTTLLGQKTTTTPAGRDPKSEGYPLPMAEILATIEGAVLIARTAIDGIKGVKETRRLIKRSFQYQMEGRGFSMIEILSPCPTVWKKTPVESLRWLSIHMESVFRTGVLIDRHRELQDWKKA